MNDQHINKAQKCNTKPKMKKEEESQGLYLGGGKKQRKLQRSKTICEIQDRNRWIWRKRERPRWGKQSICWIWLKKIVQIRIIWDGVERNGEIKEKRRKNWRPDRIYSCKFLPIFSSAATITGGRNPRGWAFPLIHQLHQLPFICYFWTQFGPII